MIPSSPSPGLQWVPADPSAWGRVLEGSDVETEISELGWLDYLGDLLTSLLSSVANWLSGHVSVGVLAAFVELLKWGLAIGLLVLALILLRRLVERLRHRAVPEDSWQSAPVVEEVPRRSPAEWQGVFRRRIGSGDVRGALQALWWAMAHGLAPSGLDSSWTTDEVLAAAPVELSAPRRSLLLQLDRLLYRGDPLDVAALRALADRVFGVEGSNVSGNQPRTAG